jgi:hypothetical protein
MLRSCLTLSVVVAKYMESCFVPSQMDGLCASQKYYIKYTNHRLFLAPVGVYFPPSTSSSRR